MKTGGTLQVSDGAGHLYAARIDGFSNGEVICSILEKEHAPSVTPFQVTLLHSLPKGARMDWLVQKSTEAGVCEIVPVHMKRSVRILPPEHVDRRRIRWQRIAMEAAGQCGRVDLPRIRNPLSLTDALKRIRNFPLRIFFDIQGKSLPLSEIRRKCPVPGKAALLVGPEGGIAPEERAILTSHGFVPASLGKEVLRVETAGVLAVALVRYEWGKTEKREEE